MKELLTFMGEDRWGEAFQNEPCDPNGNCNPGNSVCIPWCDPSGDICPPKDPERFCDPRCWPCQPDIRG
ncbi:MAG: hypothetical protein LBB09_01315 [Rickettsiales bacterium]|nr:hypothetical protein [Rickettsiales bacterium]